MYEIEPIFWIKLFSVVGIFLLISFVFNTIMRKYLKVDKRKTFSYNHVNEKHKKIDWAIRIITIIAMIVLTFIGTYKHNNEGLWGFVPSISIFVSIAITEMVRVFMEWKYSANPKAYIFTLSQLLFLMVLFWITIKSDFYNLF